MATRRTQDSTTDTPDESTADLASSIVRDLRTLATTKGAPAELAKLATEATWEIACIDNPGSVAADVVAARARLALLTLRGLDSKAERQRLIVRYLKGLALEYVHGGWADGAPWLDTSKPPSWVWTRDEVAALVARAAREWSGKVPAGGKPIRGYRPGLEGLAPKERAAALAAIDAWRPVAKGHRARHWDATNDLLKLYGIGASNGDLLERSFNRAEAARKPGEAT